MVCVYCSTPCFVCISPDSSGSSGVLPCGSANDGGYPSLAGGDIGAGESMDVGPDQGDLGGEEDGMTAGTASRHGAYGNYSVFGDKKSSYAVAPRSRPCACCLSPLPACCLNGKDASRCSIRALG